MFSVEMPTPPLRSALLRYHPRSNVDLSKTKISIILYLVLKFCNFKQLCRSEAEGIGEWCVFVVWHFTPSQFRSAPLRYHPGSYSSMKHVNFRHRGILNHQWKGINCKQSTRWQHLSWLKASVFFSLPKKF
jgi:hypothetical protein